MRVARGSSLALFAIPLMSIFSLLGCVSSVAFLTSASSFFFPTLSSNCTKVLRNRYRVPHQRRNLCLPLENYPIVDAVHFKSFKDKQIFEQFFEIFIVRRILKVELPAIIDVGSELGRKIFAEFFDGSGDLDLFDAFVLLLLGLGMESLPGQGTAAEIHQHIPQSLQVVPATLLYSQVRAYARIACRPRQTFLISAFDVLAGLGVDESFGQSVVDDVD